MQKTTCIKNLLIVWPVATLLGCGGRATGINPTSTLTPSSSMATSGNMSGSMSDSTSTSGGNGTTTAGATTAGTTTGGATPPADPNVRTIYFTNHCANTVWVGALNATPQLPLPNQGGWQLDAAQSMKLTLPRQWSGRFWGRTGCVFDNSGKGTCDTGDCGGKVACDGAGGAPPASLLEATFAAADGQDFYDISLVDGYNLPVSMGPVPATFTPTNPKNPYDCGTPRCIADLNKTCPAGLQRVVNGQVVACASACDQFNTDAYCCRGVYGTSPTCPPTTYSQIFKTACPGAYSYAYDDATSTFTCRGTDYQITFCP